MEKKGKKGNMVLVDLGKCYIMSGEINCLEFQGKLLKCAVVVLVL